MDGVSSSDSTEAGVELAVRDAGRGPAIVLVHGLVADLSVWSGVVGPLVERFRVLTPDLRGHGQSPAPLGSTYSFTEMAGDLLRLMDAKRIAAAHLVGLSAGAHLALRMGLDHPARVRSVTLVSGAAYVDAHTRSVVARWAEIYQAEGADAFALRLLKDLYYPDWMEAHLDVADRLRQEVAKRDYGPALLWAREVSTFDERKRIASLAPPALVIQAMDDQVVDASHGRILRQSIARAQIRILAETGHMIPVERPGETAEAIGTFVTALENGAEPGRVV